MVTEDEIERVHEHFEENRDMSTRRASFGAWHIEVQSEEDPKEAQVVSLQDTAPARTEWPWYGSQAFRVGRYIELGKIDEPFSLQNMH